MCGLEEMEGSDHTPQEEGDDRHRWTMSGLLKIPNAHLFKFQVVEKTHSSATLSMTHEGCLFLDLRAPRDPLVRV